MKSANPFAILVALIFLVLGFAGSYMAGCDRAGGLVEGPPLASIFVLFTWAPALAGIVACVATLGIASYGGGTDKADRPKTHATLPDIPIRLLLVVISIEIFFAVRWYLSWTHRNE